MRKLTTVCLLILLAVTATTSPGVDAGIKLPGRKQAINGKTYFGSEQLLNTEIDDVKPFIADFTLPEAGLEVTGTPAQIYEQLKSYEESNLKRTELVINLKAQFDNDTSTAKASTRLNMTLDFLPFLKLKHVQEFWLFIYTDFDSATERFWTVKCIWLNITNQSFEKLRKLHIISMSKSTQSYTMIVPHSFNDVMASLDTFVLRGTLRRHKCPNSQRIVDALIMSKSNFS